MDKDTLRMPPPAPKTATANTLSPGAPSPGAAMDTIVKHKKGKRQKVRLSPGHSQLDWMKLTQKTPVSQLAGVAQPGGKYTLAECRLHNSRDDAWMVYQGRIYNITPYLAFHPGSETELMRGAGEDATAMFNEIHPWVNMHGMLEKCFVGTVVPQTKKDSVKSEDALHPEQWRQFPVLSIEPCTGNKLSLRIRFGLAEGQSLGLGHAARHLLINTGSERAYTPVSPLDAVGYFDLVVKIYSEGKVTPTLANLKVGESVAMRGPRGALSYHGDGVFHIGRSLQYSVSNVALVAAGSGIAPIFQFVQVVLSNPEDKLYGAPIHLLYCNHDIDDIILHSELDALAAEHPNFIVTHALSEAPSDASWKGEQGHVDDGMLLRCLPMAGERVFTLICGPPTFHTDVVSLLHRQGHMKNSIYEF